MNEETKEQAIKLRQEGYTYPQIVEELNGEITLDQCKYLLKGLVKKDTQSQITDIVMRLAKRPEGVTNKEIRQEVFKLYGAQKASELLKDKAFISNLKRKIKARKNSTGVLFRPEWMKETCAVTCLNEMNMIAHCIFERIQEMADEYCYEFDGVDKGSVVREIVKLANDWSLPESLSDRVERNQSIASSLCERIDQSFTPKPYEFPCDEEFDRLCI